jgi:stage III sporulation protein AF
MIETLTNWVKGLMMLVLFAAFLELILPSSNMQKFVRLIIGLLIMLAILNPMIDFLTKDFNWKAIPSFKAQASNEMNLNLDGSKEKKEQLIYTMYKKELENQMKLTVESLHGVASAKVVLNIKNKRDQDKNKMIHHVQVFVKPVLNKEVQTVDKIDLKQKKNERQLELNSELKNMILHTLCELYQIPAEKFEIKSWYEEIG